MDTPNLLFNILTFDFPAVKPLMYFSKTDSGKSKAIHKSIFPVNIESIFPGVLHDGTVNIFTTFTTETEGFKKLEIDFDNENPDFIKRYYNRLINYYFKVTKQQIVKVGFINDNQIWLHSKKHSTNNLDIYERFSIKVLLKTVSRYPELLISYDGQSTVIKDTVAILLNHISPTNFNWVLDGKNLRKWEYLNEDQAVDYTKYFPVLNKKIHSALHMPHEAPNTDENRYIKYNEKINIFYRYLINKPEFKKIIPIHDNGFIKVNPLQIDKVSDESNLLLFRNGTGLVPKYDFKKLKPYKNSPFKNIHLFFIVHIEMSAYATVIKDQLGEKGFKSFKGLLDYANIPFHTEDGFSITFKNKENPIPEIEEKLNLRKLNTEVQYLAIYISPYGKFEPEKNKREIYYKLKEVLLNRRIASQVIDPIKMESLGERWVYSLPNIAIAVLAKLDGIPWQLNAQTRKELVVGIGAFKHQDDGVQYIGSAFSFDNNGKFQSFDYFMKDEIDILAGKIAHSVRKFAAVNNEPERLIIHFYKRMSERELQYIEYELQNLNLDIPVFIVSINKTESEDIIAFDVRWKELMPESGIFINIGNGKYLLFNNTRYSGSTHSMYDGYPFPIKLAIDCSDKEQLKDVRIIKELIDQVYQFSRLYWKSVRQQNLPVTIKYPEMVAQIAPHFNSPDIPIYGKNSLWFL